jgi:hypothetical protein
MYWLLPFCDQKDKQRGTLVENVLASLEQENKEERKTLVKNVCSKMFFVIQRYCRSRCVHYILKLEETIWGITAFYSLLSYQEISSTI